jgi:hypothetical protein
VIFYLLVVAGCSVLFFGLSFWLSRLPVSLINLPHKEFWLAPERKEKTSTYLTRYFLRFASAALVLLFYIFYQSFQVAVGNAMTLSHPIAALVVYLVLLFVWTVRMILKFKSPYDD